MTEEENPEIWSRRANHYCGYISKSFGRSVIVGESALTRIRSQDIGTHVHMPELDCPPHHSIQANGLNSSIPAGSARHDMKV